MSKNYIQKDNCQETPIYMKYLLKGDALGSREFNDISKFLLFSHNDDPPFFQWFYNETPISALFDFVLMMGNHHKPDTYKYESKQYNFIITLNLPEKKSEFSEPRNNPLSDYIIGPIHHIEVLITLKNNAY